MLAHMSRLFKSTVKQSEKEFSTTSPGCYIAIAHPSYGKKLDIIEILQGHFNIKFQNAVLFRDYCGRKIFCDEESAILEANQRSVTENSAYVLGLSCTPDKVADMVNTGHFNQNILYAKNVSTQEIIPINKISLSTTRPSTPPSP